MRDDVTIWYTGAHYQLGRWRHGYGVWATGGAGAQPIAQWPETPTGWSAAWAWFTSLEPPGAITHLSELTTTTTPPATTTATAAGAVVLLAVGVMCGIAGLFPGYVGGANLAGQPAELVPHAIYLAAWTLSAALILSGGARRRAGALLGLGTGLVTFGLFFADVGMVIAGGVRLLGAGLILGVAGWLACTIGAALAVWAGAAGAPRRPRAHAKGPVAVLVAATVAGLGTAIAFAPSWDSYTLRTSAGLAQTVTAGNAFANPGPVIAGDLAVMVLVAVLAVAAGLWRPLRLGAALLAGAAIPMVAQAISAVVQVTEPVSPTAFGISPAQAARAGLTVSSGLTPVFWVYCAFTAALALTGGWMALLRRRADLPASPAPANSWGPTTGTVTGTDDPAAGPAGHEEGQLA